MITQKEIAKMRVASHLLPPPGDVVAIDLLDGIAKLLAVYEAACGLFELCEHDLGMDKPELTDLRRALEALE